MRFLVRKLRHALYLAKAYGNSTLRERRRLAALPRYVETVTDLPGFAFKIPDAASFLASWDAIFYSQIYKFNHINNSPRILDCGANVGVSCIYFRKLFPNAKITAFEPDPSIFSYLKTNLASAGYHDVELIAKGVWSSNTTLRFRSEGADAGRIESGGSTNSIEIPTIRLRDFVGDAVDLLKLDIEGAETEVILDIAPCLGNVRNIFVEYHSFTERPQVLGKLIACLIGSGFRLQIHPMIFAPRPFVEVSSYNGMDMQLNVFGFRNEFRS